MISVGDFVVVCCHECGRHIPGFAQLNFLGPNGIANVAVVIRENVCGSGLTTVAALGFADVLLWCGPLAALRILV